MIKIDKLQTYAPQLVTFEFSKSDLIINIVAIKLSTEIIFVNLSIVSKL